MKETVKYFYNFGETIFLKYFLVSHVAFVEFLVNDI